jgi:hypothetical protein
MKQVVKLNLGDYLFEPPSIFVVDYKLIILFKFKIKHFIYYFRLGLRYFYRLCTTCLALYHRDERTAVNRKMAGVCSDICCSIRTMDVFSIYKLTDLRVE